MSEPKDPFSEFARKRRSGLDSVAPEPMDASSIDDMLDALDRVLSDEECAINEEAVDPAPIIETVRAILTELAESCDRLEQAAEQEGDRVVGEFVLALRPRLWLLIHRVNETPNPNPAAGPIEIELDYAGLHDFMMCPDIDRLAS